MPTAVQFQIQTPRTYRNLPSQIADLQAVTIPKDLFPSKLGVGPIPLTDVASSTATTVTRTVTFPLIQPLFDRVFTQPGSAVKTLVPILQGRTLALARVKRVITTAVLL